VPLTAAVAAQRLALALARKTGIGGSCPQLRRRHRALWVLPYLIGTALTGASALEVGPSLMAAFKAMDVDLSGKVTRSEFEEWVYTTGALKVRGRANTSPVA
jgi:hypothetical protein